MRIPVRKVYDKTTTPTVKGTTRARKGGDDKDRKEPTATKGKGKKRKKNKLPKKGSPKKGAGSAIRPLEIEDSDSDWET